MAIYKSIYLQYFDHESASVVTEIRRFLFGINISLTYESTQDMRAISVFTDFEQEGEGAPQLYKETKIGFNNHGRHNNNKTDTSLSQPAKETKVNDE